MATLQPEPDKRGDAPKLVADIPVEWGVIDTRRQLGIIQEIKALLNNPLSDNPEAVSLRKHMLSMALYSEPDNFFNELERLILLLVVQERVKVDGLMKQLIEPMVIPTQLPPDAVADDGVEVVNGYRKEILEPDYEYPYAVPPDQLSDDEVKAYLDRMSSSLSESPHYEQVKSYFWSKTMEGKTQADQD